MYCKNCGTLLNGGQFCSKCGCQVSELTKVESSENQNSGLVNPNFNMPVGQNGNVQNSNLVNEKVVDKYSRFSLIAFGIGLAIIIFTPGWSPLVHLIGLICGVKSKKITKKVNLGMILNGGLILLTFVGKVLGFIS